MTSSSKAALDDKTNLSETHKKYQNGDLKGLLGRTALLGHDPSGVQGHLYTIYSETAPTPTDPANPTVHQLRAEVDEARSLPTRQLRP